jgi:pimeloyl-ACP methyl ester carboxylesterase
LASTGSADGQVSPQEIQSLPAWNRYVSETESAYEVQPACRPASFLHEGELKGVVVLFHGFTACPQQYFVVAKAMQQQGWDVLLPLNPGHGMKRGLSTKEQSRLPNKDDFPQRFSTFVQQINGIIRQHPSTHRVVGGLSLGGALATSAMIDAPNLYERGLVMAPFYRLSGAIANVVGGLKNVDQWSQKLNPDMIGSLTNFALSTSIGWGAGCEKETKRGRQGICNFDLTHLIAAQQFGFELSRDKTLAGHLQFIGVEGDMAVDVERIKWFFENKVKSAGSDKQFCLYPKPASHSLASRFDNPDENKFWLPAFEADVQRFVTLGSFFSTAPRKIEGYSACRT